MTVYYQLDPDVVRWNLHFIDVCSHANHTTTQAITCSERDVSQIESINEGFSNQTNAIVENDEVIAYTFQEELSRVAEAELLGSSSTSAVDEHQTASILSQDWCGSQSDQQKSGENTGPLYQTEELSMNSKDQEHLPEIENESSIDGELGKRLNQMVPVPHVPKINGNIPSSDEAMSDHERLLNRLQLYDLEELKISGDGNCQFRSLSDQIYRTPEHHKFVRDQVINQLKSQPDLYENYVPMEFGEYLKMMSKSGEWGDHITLQAAADVYGVKIFVITSFKDTCYIEILPQTQKSNRIIFLSFWAEVHYNSIYPMGELPGDETVTKKWWW